MVQLFGKFSKSYFCSLTKYLSVLSDYPKSQLYILNMFSLLKQHHDLCPLLGKARQPTRLPSNLYFKNLQKTFYRKDTEHLYHAFVY